MSKEKCIVIVRTFVDNVLHEEHTENRMVYTDSTDKMFIRCIGRKEYLSSYNPKILERYAWTIDSTTWSDVKKRIEKRINE